MNLNPVNDFFCAEIRRVETNRVIPLPLVLVNRFQRTLDVHAPLDASRILGVDVIPIGFAQGLEAFLPSPLEIRGLLDGFLESQGCASRSALATALATATFARPLNSVNPPHPPSPASSLSGSSPEMSLVRPSAGSK